MFNNYLQIATRVGKVPDARWGHLGGGRCKASLMYLDNSPFSFCDGIGKYAQMGVGYSHFFYVSLFFMIICFFPFMFTTTYEVIRNRNGNDCVEPEKLKSSDNFQLGNANPVTHLNAASHWLTNKDVNSNSHGDPDSQDVYANGVASKTKNLEIFMLTFCYTKWYLKDDDCTTYLKDLHCRENFSSQCHKLAITKFKKEYDSKICVKNAFTRASLGNRINLKEQNEKSKFYSKYRSYVDIICVFVMYYVFIWMRQNLMYSANTFDKIYTTVNDYTVIIKGLPYGNMLNRVHVDLNKILNDLFKEKGFTVTQINFVYDTEQYLSTKEEYLKDRQEINKKKYTARKKELEDKGLDNDNTPLLDKEDFSTMLISNVLKAQEQQFDLGNPKDMVGIAFVSFEYADQAEKVLKDYGPKGFMNSIKSCFSESSSLSLEIQDQPNYPLVALPAPEPRDIIWENQAYTYWQLFWRRNLSNLISILVFFIGLIGITYIKILFVSSNNIIFC